MKSTNLFISSLCLITLLFASFASPKDIKKFEETSAVTEISQEKETKAVIKTVKGLLIKSENGNYTVVTKIKTKNRADYHLVCAAGFEEVFAQLDSFEGKNIQISGNVIEQKNPWNWTIAVTSVK